MDKYRCENVEKCKYKRCGHSKLHKKNISCVLEHCDIVDHEVKCIISIDKSISKNGDE